MLETRSCFMCCLQSGDVSQWMVPDDSRPGKMARNENMYHSSLKSIEDARSSDKSCFQPCRLASKKVWSEMLAILDNLFGSEHSANQKIRVDIQL